ncbi:MAG: phage late control D family protein [bacterium]|nr:phage late control D family protein [bacterium]
MMPLTDIAAAAANFYAPRFEIEIENDRIAANLSKQIIDLSVEEKLDEGASFTIKVNDEYDRGEEKFKWMDHELFQVGNKITIKVGYESNLLQMIVGNITGLEPSFFAADAPTLTVKGQDLSYDYMKRRSPERTFVQMPYSAIAETVAGEAGLLIVADSTDQYETQVRKNNNESYFAFLGRLAGEVDRQFKMDGQTIYFVEPGDDQREIMTLQLGRDIISFSPNLNTSSLYSEVEVRGHNPRDPRTAIVGRASAGSERSQESGRQTGSQIASQRSGRPKKVITDIVVNSVSHANAIALAELNKASDGLIEGEGECIGIPQIRTGVNIKLTKMGERFSGKYYVKGTTHTINTGGYKTRFSVKRNAL